MKTDWHSSSLTRSTVVDKDYKNTQNVRRFMVGECGPDSGLIASLCSGYEMTYQKTWVMWLMSGSADISFRVGTYAPRSQQTVLAHNYHAFSPPDHSCRPETQLLAIRRSLPVSAVGLTTRPAGEPKGAAVCRDGSGTKQKTCQKTEEDEKRDFRQELL